MSGLWQLNYMLFQEINMYAGINPWLDAVMVFCANSLIFCWPLVLLMLWGVPFSWRKRSIRPDEAAIIEQRRSVVLWTAIACLLAYAFNLLIEQFVFEPRPFVSHKVHVLITHTADSSFPSDHTAWSFAVVGMLVFAFFPALISAWRKRSMSVERSGDGLRIPFLLMVPAFLMAAIIGLARIFVGVHYPDDVLGGAIDGLLAAAIVTIVRQWLRGLTSVMLRFATMLHLA